MKMEIFIKILYISAIITGCKNIGIILSTIVNKINRGMD